MSRGSRGSLRKEGHQGLRGALDVAALADAVDLDAGPGRRLAVGDLGPALDPLTRAVSAVTPGLRAVRVVGFNKVAASNRGVSWHQDRIVAVAERVEAPGWSGWSRKGGVWHGEPPSSVLGPMGFTRVFLDPVGPDNGGMQFAVGSHLAGVVGSDDATGVAEGYGVETEAARPGDVLMLAMLTLHRSLPSGSFAQRRVLRVDFAADPLPLPLAWAEFGRDGA